jgi:hypothetical protein
MSSIGLFFHEQLTRLIGERTARTRFRRANEIAGRDTLTQNRILRRNLRANVDSETATHTRETKMSGNWKLAIAAGLVTIAGTVAVQAAENADEVLIKALAGAKTTLLQGIAHVAKGTEVPTEAKYEMDKGKLALTVYTSAKGFDTPAEDNSFNEYGGDATAAAWTPDKEVFADLKHIARSAQYHTLLAMTKITIPAIIQKAAAQGTVFSVKEKIRNGKPVFEVMTAQGGSAKTTFYDLMTGEPATGL